MTALPAEPYDTEGIPEAWWESIEPPPSHTIEIIRGELVVTPSPTPDHVFAQTGLLLALQQGVPDGYIAVHGLVWRLAVAGVVAAAPQPDLMVVERVKGLTAITKPPLLAVEVLSPSDLQALPDGLTRIEGKRLDYAANGLVHYLEVDLLQDPPIIACYKFEPNTTSRWDVHPNTIRVVRLVEGDERLVCDEPFHFELVPSDL